MDTEYPVGWRLEPEERERLLARFPPAFPDVIADHVTLGRMTSLPADVQAAVVGYASDGTGLEALAVSIDGTYDRPDGSIYHMTWSLNKSKGRRAIESNALLQKGGFISLDKPIGIRLRPSKLG